MSTNSSNKKAARPFQILVIDSEVKTYCRLETSAKRTQIIHPFEMLCGLAIDRLVIRPNVPISFSVNNWLANVIKPRLAPKAEILDERKYQ